MNKNYIIVFFVSMLPLIELRGAIPIAVGYDLPIVPSYIVAVIGNIVPVPFIFFFARKVLEWGKDKKYIGKFCTWCITKGVKGSGKLLSKSGNTASLSLQGTTSDEIASPSQASIETDNGATGQTLHEAEGMGISQANATPEPEIHEVADDGAADKKKRRSDWGLYLALLLFVGIPLPGTGAWTGTLAASFLNMDFKKSVLAVTLGVILAGGIMLAASLGVFGAIRLAI